MDDPFAARTQMAVSLMFHIPEILLDPGEAGAFIAFGVELLRRAREEPGLLEGWQSPRRPRAKIPLLRWDIFTIRADAAHTTRGSAYPGLTRRQGDTEMPTSTP